MLRLLSTMKPTYTHATGSERASGRRLGSKTPAAAKAAMPTAVNAQCSHVSATAKEKP